MTTGRSGDGMQRNERSLAFIKPVLRRTLAERELLGTIVVVVLISTLVFASIPRLFNAMADDGISHAVRITSSFERNIGMSRGIRIEPGSPDLFAPVDAEGAQFQERLADSIQSIIARRTFTVDTVQYRVVLFEGTPPAVFPRYVTMRHQSEVDPHIRIVEGRLPELTQATMESTRTVTGQQTPQVFPVVEIAISTETARQLSVEVGDRLVMEPHTNDTLARAVPATGIRFLPLR